MNGSDRSHSLAGLFSGENRKPALILLWAPVVLTTWKYYGTKAFFLRGVAPGLTGLASPGRAAEWFEYGTSFVLLGVVSLVFIRFVFRERLSGYGVGIGDWRFGLKALAAMAPVMALLSFCAARQAPFVAEYPLFGGACVSAGAFVVHALAYLAYYAGWETFFRGLVQFGLRDRLGDGLAILVQTGLSCLAHIGKPGSEIYGAIAGGLLFGIVALRSRSILYVVLAHWVLGASLDLFICLK